MDTFTQAYIECALWASTDENGEPLDGLGLELAPETLKQFEEDCAAFQKTNAQWIGYGRDCQAGQDFWLTRNRHGAGFWDSGWPKAAADALTADSHAWGSCDLYVGDDGLGLL